MVFEEFNPTDGGAYSYQELLLKSINEYRFHPDIEVVNIIFYKSRRKEIFDFKKEAIYIKRGVGGSLRDSVKHSATKYLNLQITRRNPLVNFLSAYVLKKRNRKAEEILRRNKIDLIYYLRTEWEVLNYPFIATHWDNCHKSIPPFPEVALDGMYEKRERYHIYTLNKALAILCESYAGAAEVRRLNCYDDSKIKVLPIFAGDVINKKFTREEQEKTLLKYQLEHEKFFLYPAQFWAHKNHYNLILAFNKFIKENEDDKLKLVLCGSDKGNCTYIKEVINSLSLNERVLVPGFISVEELNQLYSNALALTMSTFLGPTNMPLIEAAHLKCPVLCSNLEGHKEILGENAIYFSPASADSIKDAMIQIYDVSLREKLKASAFDHIQRSHFNVANALQILDEVFCEIVPIRKTWGH